MAVLVQTREPMMAESQLWNRYHTLMEDYLAYGEESRLRQVVALSDELALSQETTSGRIAASIEAVLSAYTRMGVQSIDVEIGRRTGSHEELEHALASGDGDPEDRLISLRSPDAEDDGVVIEVRGEWPGEPLPVVRLDYVAEDDHAAPHRAIEPRKLRDVLTGFLAGRPGLLSGPAPFA